MLSKELIPTEKVLPIPKKERKFDKTFEENFMQKVPETLALQTMKQTLCRIIKKLETLINTGFQRALLRAWQQLGNTTKSPF